MLQTAVNRVQALWPSAEIHVLAADKERLRCLCPTATCVDTVGYWEYTRPGSLFGPLGRKPLGFERWLLTNHPDVALRILRLNTAIRSSPYKPVLDYVNAVRDADFVVASGGGYLTDMFPHMVTGVYTTVRLAKHFGKPVTLLGQGIGPLERPELRQMARDTLRSADMIGLREGLSGPEYIREFGIDPAKTMVTGDDAIELAFNARSETLGSGIGVNLRVADYSGVEQSKCDPLRQALQTVSDQTGAHLVPLPISQPSDTKAIEAILHQSMAESGGDYGINSPVDLTNNIQKCRIVVTGSYHAAVFALSQGRPALCIANSDYYVDKFAGLSAQFGGLCRLTLLSEPDAYQRIESEALTLWDQAPVLRPLLLDHARSQIEAGHDAYERFYSQTNVQIGRDEPVILHTAGR